MAAPAAALYTGRIYPGLRPFEAGDALLFFGRDKQIDELLRRLEDTRFLGVVGLSGSGKSSLVRAGLLPALQRGHLTGAGSQWRVAVMRPGSDPLGGLAGVLDETLSQRDGRLATLKSGSLGLVDAASQGRKPDENLLLVVDQFEEIFRFQDSDHLKAPEATGFVELLLAATRDYEPVYRIYVVITLRSDYLGECARFEGLPEALNESQYLVPRMTREQLREAIEGPAALGGVELSGDLLQELLDKTGDDPDQLPVLQHLLMRMWDIRRQNGAHSHIGREQYETVGGWDDALNSHADRVWNDLGDRKELGKRIFQRLTERRQAGREVRRPATVLELARVADVTPATVKEVVEHFREEGCNFLTSPNAELTDDSVIDISHESLIRRWKILSEWARAEADSGEWYQRLQDRIRIGVPHVVDPELESALQAREKGRWNEAWAERYAKAKEGIAIPYAEVIGFLDKSKQRRSDELAKARRIQAAVALAAIIFAGLSLFAGYSYFLARKNAQVALARQLASDSALATSATTYDNRVPALTLSALLGIESARRADTIQSYEALWGAIYRAGHETARWMHPGEVRAVAFSPDGAMLATGSADNTARLFDIRTRREVARLAHNGLVYAVAFSPDGALLATASKDKIARVFEVRTGRVVAQLEHRDSVYSVAFSADGTLVATASADKTARVFEPRTGHEIARLTHAGEVNKVAFSPDGTRVATASDDKTARVFEARTGHEISRLTHEGVVEAVAFSPDATLVATGAQDKTARVFEARTGHEISRVARGDAVYSVAFSPDGTLVATGSRDKTASVFRARTGREVARLVHENTVYRVAFSPDGTLVATGSLDNTARVFEAQTGREVARLVHQDIVSAVAFSPDGTQLATASNDKTARLLQARVRREVAWLGCLDAAAAVSPDETLVATPSNGKTERVVEARTGREVAVIAHQSTENLLNTVRFSPDGTLLAMGLNDGKTARVFESRTGREVSRLALDGTVAAVAFNADGTLVATGSADRTARVFEARTGREVARLAIRGVVQAVAFSPDGTRVAAGSVGTASVFETRTGREVARLAPPGILLAIAFSPDGTLVATGSYDNTARVFEVRTGREVARLTHLGIVFAAAFSPDGTLVATGSVDKTARVFEARTGREIARLALGDTVWSAKFVSAGRLLRCISGDTDLHVTQDFVYTSDLVADACSKLDRNLTPEEWKTHLGAVPYRKTCEHLNPLAQPPKR